MPNTAFTFTLPTSLMEEIKLLANKWHISKTAIIKMAISKMIEQEAGDFPLGMTSETKNMIHESREAYASGKSIKVSTPEEFDAALNV
jgi:predicted DNA-binding protein